MKILLIIFGKSVIADRCRHLVNHKSSFSTSLQQLHDLAGGLIPNLSCDWGQGPHRTMCHFISSAKWHLSSLNSLKAGGTNVPDKSHYQEMHKNRQNRDSPNGNDHNQSLQCVYNGIHKRQHVVLNAMKRSTRSLV